MKTIGLKFSPGDLLVPKAEVWDTFVVLLVTNYCRYNEYNCYGICSKGIAKMMHIDSEPFYIGKEDVERNWEKKASNITVYLRLFLEKYADCF